MTWTEEIRQFITEHQTDDTTRLLLSSHRYPSIDVPFAVEQIEARKRLRTKLPEWFAVPDLIMSGRIPAEQCSSEQTARFKRSVMSPDAHSLCDMTGGMGVDFWYMSQGLDYAVYTERQSALCEAACHNFAVLSEVLREASGTPCQKIEIRNGVSTDLPIPDVDVIYLDPARRSTDGSRIYEISDCEPDVVAWQQELLKHCRQLITKVSPMADITRTLSRLEGVTDVYVISVRNECKELLVVQQPAMAASCARDLEVCVHCVDFLPSRCLSFDYMLADRGRQVRLATSLGKYFYEPDVSIMKAQGFAPLSARFDVAMLDADCHYFTSDQLIGEFPGRIFEIDEVLPSSSKLLKSLRTKAPQANIATRNFPLTAEQLRKRTGIRDGGDTYLFGASMCDLGAVLLVCHKINS